MALGDSGEVGPSGFIIGSEPKDFHKRDYANPLGELTPELSFILGRPNFQCITWANLLRANAQVIAHKAEAEQAAVIHWMLGFYLRHGNGWREHWGADADAKLLAVKKP